MTIGDLFLAERALRTINALVFPPRVALALQRLTQSIDTETRAAHAQEEAWVRELGEPQADGSVVISKPEHRALFLERFTSMVAVVVPDKPWPTVTLADLETGEFPTTHQPAKFSPTDLLALGVLLSSDLPVPNTGTAHDDQGATPSGVAASDAHRAGDGVAAPS